MYIAFQFLWNLSFIIHGMWTHWSNDQLWSSTLFLLNFFVEKIVSWDDMSCNLNIILYTVILIFMLIDIVNKVVQRGMSKSVLFYQIGTKSMYIMIFLLRTLLFDRVRLSPDVRHWFWLNKYKYIYTPFVATILIQYYSTYTHAVQKMFIK